MCSLDPSNIKIWRGSYADIVRIQAKLWKVVHKNWILIDVIDCINIYEMGICIHIRFQ